MLDAEALEWTAAVLVVKERAVAMMIFNLFEQVYYQLDVSARHGAPYERELLEKTRNYFTARLLTNPRLRYLWDDSGGKLGYFF